MNPRLTVAALAFALASAGCQRKVEGAPAGQALTGADQPVAVASDGVVQQTVEQPGLSLATVDGGHYDLAEHRGKWVLVNFWATWCGPCLKEMPELSALHGRHGQVEVVGLAYEDTEPAQMLAFLKQHPVSYPIAILDTYNPPKDFETPRGLPMSYLIDPQGRVAHQFLGPVSAHEVETMVAPGGRPG